MARLMCRLLAVLLLAHVLYAAPVAQSVSYTLKSASVQQVGLDVATFRASFDRPLFTVPPVECSYNPCVPAACVCDYASQGAQCGRAVGGTCSCNASLCSGNWTDLVPGALIEADMAKGDSLPFRVFVDAASGCSPIRIIAHALNGDPDISYLTHLGPNEDPSDPATIRWHSVNSGRDDTVLCPSDPTYRQGGGTYFGEIYAFQATKLILEVIADAASSLPTSPGSVPSQCPVGVQCLAPDFDNIFDLSPSVTKAVQAIVPCTGAAMAAAFSLALSNNGNGVATGFYTLNPARWPSSTDPADITEDVYVRSDFPRHRFRIALPACPLGNVTTIYVTYANTLVPSGNLPSSVLVRFTYNATRLAPVPITSIARTDYDFGHFLSSLVSVTCGSIYVPSCPRFYTDDYCRMRDLKATAAPRDSAIALSQPVPAYGVENVLWPPFPWLYYVKRSAAVTDGTLHAAVEGGAGSDATLNSNPASPVNTSEFVVSVILGAEYSQNGLSTQERYITDVKSCRLNFIGPLTDASGGPVVAVPVPVAVAPVCLPAAFKTQRDVVSDYIEQLKTGPGIDVVGDINSKLDVLNFLDTWLGCVDYTASLLERKEVISFLPQSTICSPSLDPASADTDPCCSPDLLWESCCVAERRAAVLSVETYTLPSEAALAASCPALACSSSYLTSFAAVQQGSVDFSKGCSGVSQSLGKFFRNRLQFWKECAVQTFGAYEEGQPCVADDECVAGVCDLVARQCVATPDQLADAFLTCFVDSADPFILTTIRRAVAPSANSSSELVAALRANFTAGDCLPPVGVDFTVQTHWTWTSFGCASLCTRDFPFHYKVADPPLACAFSGFGLDVCPADPIWLEPAPVSAATCAAVATRSTAVPPLAVGTQHCAACFGSSPYCYSTSVPVASCPGTFMCFHAGPFSANFTTTNATQCNATFACTAPCYNTDGSQRACLTEPECTGSGGSCSSDDVFDNVGHNYACVLPTGKYFIPTERCQDLYGILGEANIIPMGCVDGTAGLDAAGCAAKNGKYITRAFNASACAAAGCGCETVSPLDLDETTPYAFLTPSGVNGCGACGTQCVDYFTWTPGRWLPYSAVPLVVATAQTVAVAAWQPAALDYTQLGQRTEAALSQQFALQIAAEQQCRFNQLAASVAGATCACPTSGSSNVTAARECLLTSELSDTIPLGVAAPCGGSSTVVQATPFSLTFEPASLPAGVCTSIDVLTLPRENFRNPPPVNPTSTFIKGRTPNEFEFVNKRGEPVGFIVADGFVVNVTGSVTPLSIYACLPFAPPGGGDANKDFTRAAIAVQVFGGLIQPANNASIELVAASPLYDGETSLSFCARVAIPAGTASFSVLPVVVHPNWASKAKRIFEGGSSAIIFFTAFFYLGALLYALWVLWAMLWKADFSYTGHIAWPIAMFFAARMLYFMLLGAEVFGGRDINTGEYFLTDLPINLYISCLVYLVLFWILTVGSSLGKFYPSVLVFNVVLYLIFLVFILLFALLPKDKAPTAALQCLLGRRERWPPRRIVSAAYKGFLAVLCLVIASLFGWFGRRIYSWLKKVEDITMAKGDAGGVLDIVPPSQRILIISIYNVVSLIVTAVLLVVSNVVSWRNNFFACIIAWFFDLIPLLLLLWVITRKEEGADEEAANKPNKGKAVNINTPAAIDNGEAPPVGPTAVKLKSWDADSESERKDDKVPEFVPEGERELQRFDSNKQNEQQLQRFDTNSLAPRIGGGGVGDASLYGNSLAPGYAPASSASASANVSVGSKPAASSASASANPKPAAAAPAAAAPAAAKPAPAAAAVKAVESRSRSASSSVSGSSESKSSSSSSSSSSGSSSSKSSK